MKQSNIDKFSLGRVFKLLKLDMLYNRNIIVALLSIIFIVTMILHFQVSGSNVIEAHLAVSFVSFLLITYPLIIILFCVIVFRRLNKGNPMHISLIPANAKEKYTAIVIEFIIMCIISVIFFSFFAFFSMLISDNINTLFALLDEFSDAFENVFEQVFESISGDCDVLYFLNALGFSYLAISPMITGFGILSSACISFNRGWKALLFIIGVYFAIQIIFAFSISGLTFVPKEYLDSEIFANIVYYFMIVFATILNVGFIAFGYRNVKNKQNKQL